MLDSLLDKAIDRTLSLLNKADTEQGKPFRTPGMMVPHTDSRFYGWTHYGVMIPDLPAPHRFFSIMSVIGTPGALAFDTDHALVDTPRRNATVVSGTAATYPRHFGGYSISRDCDMAADGSRIRFGDEVQISGACPDYHVQARYGDFELDIDIRNTDKVSWFMKSRIYDHLSLLSEYRGVVRLRGKNQDIAGLCTFEYAACISPYSLYDRPLPPALKAPLDFFTYHIINLDAHTQLLLTFTRFRGRPGLRAAYVRGLDTYSLTYADIRFEELEKQVDDTLSPDGKAMRLPRVFRWTVRDAGRVILELTGTVDTPMTYGLGSGYVGGYHYEGQFHGRRISGPGYIEYIDRRHG